MYRFILTLLITFSCIVVSFAQTVNEVAKDSLVDTKYREDQFYIGATYNILINKPDNVSQNGFSTGLHLGFIRDFPVNKKRTYAIGVGLGLSMNSFNQNLGISITDKQTTFGVLRDNEVSYNTNRFYTYLVELPIEFRWRNSTATTYKFWRVYPGFKMSYMFTNSYQYEGEPENVTYRNIDAFNRLQYGLTLSSGYNTWNIHVYYALNSLFDSAKIEDQAINTSVVKVGLLFYLL